MGIRRHSGFTIVELLIVIVVIGILAAIVVVAYNGVTERAKINQASSELSSFKKAMLAYKAVNGELPPVGDAWNYGTDPPSCAYIVNLVAALTGAGYTGFKTTDPWGNCWGYDDNDCNTGSLGGANTYMESVGPNGLNGTDDIGIHISTKEATGC